MWDSSFHVLIHSLFSTIYQENTISILQIVVVQLLSYIQLFTTPETATCQASLFFTIFLSLLKLIHWVGDAIQTSHPVTPFSDDKLDSLLTTKPFISSACWADCSEAMSQVKTMSEEIKEANQAVEKVASRSKDITQILDVIRTISEQTNLLALNAAIEAARAGEHGRGFAVVADEVRALASKTRSSTDDISQLIDSLLLEVGNASTVIEKGVVRAQSAVDETSVAFDALHSVVVKVDEITNQITHIATAAEEQSLVTEEINRNLTLISDAASQLADLSTQAGDSSEALNALVAQQDSELNKLKT